MKPNQLLDESLLTTTSSDEVKIYADEQYSAEIYTPDFGGYLNVIEKNLENHGSFDDLVKQWEEDEPDEIKDARSWVADQFYAEDGNTIKTLRLREGLSQSQLAGILDSKQSYVSRIECGTVDLMYSTMTRLCESLNVDMNTLSAAINHQKEINQKK